MGTEGSAREALRVLATRLLLEHTGARGVVRLCPQCGGDDHGQPVLTGPGPLARVSLAYADGLVALAWSNHGPVGVDVERDGPPVGTYGDRRAWTRAEALLKHAGTGLAHDPRDGLPADVPTHDLRAPDGYVGTVVGRGVSWCVAGPALPGGRAGPVRRATPGTDRPGPAR
ncbi:4'-phosphopantetheinyl transferase family protein [Nocardioides deserti]|uniref:4'-phosphopantetheinyl transferase n=1 Tax=Nocardioides deserti TaxID=1588644 RepID=A0ABR6U463_9ACTN|nr:hypothetical protein [Nocardioides deserti]MBC2959227.1 hypothetical protein [Nocardioides deserti]GGO68336.1 hypothetical protein GCM10012276_01910 [Nocardioides deserti]